MFKGKTIFFWLCFCCLDGVFADELNSVSVMEGDSVSLNSGLTDIQEDDEIFWTFGNSRSLLAITDGVDNTIYDFPDGRFRGRLKLDKKTGSLTIMNITTEHAGVYTVEISSRSSSKHRFTVTVYGVFAGTDELNSVSVMEGDSVSLNSGLTEIQKGDVIIWTFGNNGPLIAKTNGVKNMIPDDLDGRFRDRLELDKKNGSLTIMNITTDHAGVYKVEISSRSSSKHRFTVTVYGPDKPDKELYERGMEKESDTSSGPSARAVAGIVVVAVLLHLAL
ncbi:hypothetical protein R3I93_016874 [Phoxinus phoxinus]|uniref:Immunoglobulin domain-containing protein n=1 Tax=Phoxinus phoxinus TaxID=58324 RepID=A0AAN9CIW8_9TELE